MIKFNVLAGKFKLSLSRLSKVTSTFIFVLYKDSYVMQFDKGFVQSYDIDYFDHFISEDGLAFNMSVIKFNGILKRFKGNEYLTFIWDDKDLTITPVKKTNKRNVNFQIPTIILKTSVEPLLFTNNDHFEELELLKNNAVGGSFCVHELIWVVEKFAIFENIKIKCSQHKLYIDAETDSYSCSANINLRKNANFTQTIQLNTDLFLNLLWLIEFDTDCAFIFCRPTTLETCIASYCDDSILVITL
tara:strand:- start:3312 stop:4046 length:735 start_codon:yes stop_codon:yes gene_type:complete